MTFIKKTFGVTPVSEIPLWPIVWTHLVPRKKGTRIERIKRIFINTRLKKQFLVNKKTAMLNKIEEFS